MSGISSSEELSDFVHFHKLMNRFSVTHFSAIVTIETEINKLINQQMEVMISFDGYKSYGKVTLMDNDLDPYLYPTDFEANWQKFGHIDKEYLLIHGKHISNSKIGSYKVKIIPLEKIRE